MINPIGPGQVGAARAGSTQPASTPVVGDRAALAEGGRPTDFTQTLREQLEQVNRVQTDAERQVESLLTGESQDITGVFTAARKAQVAFSLLMEIRNKLVDAYVELRQMRV